MAMGVNDECKQNRRSVQKIGGKELEELSRGQNITNTNHMDVKSPIIRL